MKKSIEIEIYENPYGEHERVCFIDYHEPVMCPFFDGERCGLLKRKLPVQPREIEGYDAIYTPEDCPTMDV